MKVSDRNGNSNEYRYNSLGNIDRIVDPVGLETVFAYNAFGKVSSITDPAGRITRLDYDSEGNLVQITDPDDSSRRWAYDSKRHMVKEITKAGLIQETFYDFSGRSYKAIREDGSTVSYQPLATRGLLPPEQTRSRVNAPRAYTDDSTRVRYIDPNGNLSEMTIDGRGQVISSRDSISMKILNRRDSENRITEMRDADENSINYRYDIRGNVIEVADEVLGKGIANGLYPAISYETGGPSGISVADLNTDGWLDMVVLNSTSDDLTLLFGSRNVSAHHDRG